MFCFFILRTATHGVCTSNKFIQLDVIIKQDNNKGMGKWWGDINMRWANRAMTGKVEERKLRKRDWDWEAKNAPEWLNLKIVK